ncbi:hypothetical protein [Photobacterium damselae]|uniref:hypothetical protein n=1 Tax=Photobacterium damselae TaxID=38293 RepID=UPI001F23FB25|nr:hypothetical protein [Photobacterium damselae]UKA04868.1 hypothetical protein IHC89_21735 [Photobacterium damselae subsp. damselae]
MCSIESIVKNACPNCHSNIFVKIEPNSVGAFQFDACPSCGFIELETSEIRTAEETTSSVRANIFKEILGHHGCEKLSELQKIGEQNADDEFQCVFDYSNISKDYILSCIVTQEMIDNA